MFPFRFTKDPSPVSRRGGARTFHQPWRHPGRRAAAWPPGELGPRRPGAALDDHTAEGPAPGRLGRDVEVTDRTARLARVWFGSGQDLKLRALQESRKVLAAA